MKECIKLIKIFARDNFNIALKQNLKKFQKSHTQIHSSLTPAI